jgi:uncharacterized protein (TIGR02449 family)
MFMKNNADLSELELQIDTLVKRYQEINNENILLRSKLAKLLQEKAFLIDKKQKTIAKVKQIISQVRAELP